MIECRGNVVCMEIDRSVRSQTDISSRDLAATKMPRNAALPKMPWIPGLAVAIILAACGGFDEPQGEDNDSSTAVPVAGGGVDGVEVAQATATQPCDSSAPDEFGAETMAKACGSRVEVESERTAYTELYVEPSGDRTIVTAVVPQRARRQDGTWGPIDTTLQQVGDQLVPVATVADVRFSNGGTGPFATLTREGHSITLSWPAPLPKPTVSGNIATYGEVLPDVDLVVKATDVGFTNLLVIKTARGAANPMVRHTSYRIGGDATLTATPEGGLIAEAGGVRVASAFPPVMWDTVNRQGASNLAEPNTESEPVKMARVGAAISAGHLVLTPDPSMLADPGARFPLVIDPPFIAGVVNDEWSYASADNQNAPTTDSTIAAGDPSPAAAELRVGNDPSSTHLIRSFMRFHISTLAGKQILSAKITGKVDHTWKCTDNRPTYFYRTAALSTSTSHRQSWPGPALQLLLGNDNVHANEASCNESNMTFEVGTSTLISDLQQSATANAASYFVGISAGQDTSGTNETATERWMRYFLADFKLNVTYNTTPNTPDTLTVDGKACVSGATRPFIKTTTPTLRAHVTDPDNDSLNALFTWAKWNGSSFVDEGSGTQSRVPSGSTALFNVSGNVDGGIYSFRVKSDDSPSHTPFRSSNVAGTCEWQVDITPPAVPTVTADVYKEGQTSGSVGQTGRFTFSSSSDTKSFLWGWTDPPTTPLTPSTLGGSVFIDWTPTSSGAQTLFVRAIDRAGNESNKTYQFIVAPETTALARWLLNDFSGTTQLADDTGNGNTLAITGGVLGVSGRLVPGADGLSRSAMQFDGIDDVATTSGPVLADTSKSFSVAAWVKLADNAASHRALDQVDATSGKSAFALEYDNATNAWKFTAPTADGSAFPGATSTSTPRLNTWTHLVGTYDSAAKELKLYVNGTLEKTATGITTWDANGALRIGSSWAGAISEVQLWNRVISATEAFALSDPIQVGKVGDWHMDEIGFGPAFDSSALAHDLNFFNGASIPASGAGQTGTGLRLDGVDDYAAPDGQVLHTDQSFTVSVWARPTTIAVYQTFVSQQSDGVQGGFSLYFGSESGGVWKFRMHASPTDTTNTTFAVTPALDVTTAFHHLVGVFDAQKREMRLYVDGVLKATTPMNALWQPWDATGPLLIGRHQNGTAGSEFIHGDLDEVRVYQGVVTNVTRIP
jgi:hypothetical protein